MKKNLEIKVKLTNPRLTRTRLRDLFKGKDFVRQKEVQEDIYYRPNSGRLKLRIINGNIGHLIHYFRGNKTTKRISKYTISKTNTPDEMHSILSSLCGILVKVKKFREIIIWNNVRIHTDKVIGLGNYLEIEIIFSSIKKAEKQMRGLINSLQLDEKKFIKESYSDLILKKRRINAN